MMPADLQWTSVPRWRAPRLPAAASYLACWFGHQARGTVTGLLARARPGAAVTTAGFPARWDTATEAQLARLLGECRTGARIVMAGPEATVMRAAALARAQGATAEELILVADEAGQAEDAACCVGPAGRRVFCVTCRRPFEAVAALGELVTCPGCGAGLTVDHRFSRPHAAYFGWPAGLDRH
jgi:dimethylamine monooxygenase subunit C